jgi:DNA-binding LytR/AlgR family response regulator
MTPLRVIPLRGITAVAADGNYRRVHLQGGGHSHGRRPMPEWVVRLEGRGFIQPGRSLLRLASAIQHLESRNGGLVIPSACEPANFACLEI